jgi:hypothetical protein
MRPTDAELRDTVARMEAQLSGHPLFGAYERLSERFSADLEGERDVLVSRGAVLMLLREIARSPGG